MVALRAIAQSTGPETRAEGSLRLMTFGRTRSSSTAGDSVLLVIGVGLGVARVLELGGVGIEAHELVEDQRRALRYLRQPQLALERRLLNEERSWLVRDSAFVRHEREKIIGRIRTVAEAPVAS